MEAFLGDLLEVVKKHHELCANANAHLEEDVGVAKKRRKPRDPSTPKRTRSGYILFIEDSYEYIVEKLKKKYPEVKVLMKELAYVWQNYITDAEKLKYNDLALKLKQDRMTTIAKAKNATSNDSDGDGEEEEEEDSDDDDDDDSDGDESPKHKKAKSTK